MNSKISKYLDAENILIYQMGKVGSTSIEKSLKNSIHVHSLFNMPTCPPRYAITSNTFSKLCYLEIKKTVKRSLIKKRKKIKIITFARDPSPRNISMFFQDLPYWLCLATQIDPSVMRKNEDDFLWNCFINHFPHDYPETWFKNEFSKFTGINIYDLDIDAEKKHHRIETNQFDIILLKYENIEHLPEAVYCEWGLPITLQNENIGHKKWYGELYKNFMQKHKNEYSAIAKEKNHKYCEKFGY